MKRIALLLLAAVSFAALAQMPDRAGWMAGGDDSGSGLPGGGWDWYIAGFVLALLVVSFFVPEKYAQGLWGLFWLSPFLLWGGFWLHATFLR